MTQYLYTRSRTERKSRLHDLGTLQSAYKLVIQPKFLLVPPSYLFTLLNHSTIQRNGKVKLCAIVIIAGVALRQRIVTHVERRKRHSRAVTRVTPSKLLSTRGSVVLELDCLVGHVARCCRDRRCVVANCRLFCFNRSYCEKTESEVVVEVVLMVRLMSVVSMSPAARVTVSS